MFDLPVMNPPASWTKVTRGLWQETPRYSKWINQVDCLKHLWNVNIARGSKRCCRKHASGTMLLIIQTTLMKCNVMTLSHSTSLTAPATRAKKVLKMPLQKYSTYKCGRRIYHLGLHRIHRNIGLWYVAQGDDHTNVKQVQTMTVIPSFAVVILVWLLFNFW